MALEDFTKIRRCAKCHIDKPLSEFHRAKRRGREERAYYCKLCANALRMHYYLRNEDGERERKHRWYYKNLDGNRVKLKEWREAMRQKAKDYFSDRCYLCEKQVFIKKSDFNIHHKNGINNGNGHGMIQPEDWDRCVLLCKACHYMLHGASRLPRERFSALLYQLKEKVNAR